jgi:hypothetical protein
MAVAFKAVSATGNSTTGNFSFVQPSGVVSGDLIIAFVACKGDTFTFPTGWTTILSIAGTTANGGLRVAYIVRGASAPALTVSGRGSANICFYCTAAYTGHDPTSPVTLLANATNTSPVNTTGTVSGLSQGDRVLLAFGGSDNAAFASYTESTAQLTTWTERADAGTTNGSNTRLAIADSLVPSGTIDPYGPFSGTGGGTGSSTIGVFQIVQASGGSTPVSLTPSAVGTNTLSKRVSTIKAATAIGVASILRAFPKAFAYVASGANTLAKRVGKVFTATATGVSTFAKLAAKSLSLAYAAIGTSTVLVNLRLQKLLTSVASGTVTVQKRIAKVLATVGLGVSSILKRVSLIKAVTATGLANFSKITAKILALAFVAVGTNSFSAIKAILRSFAAAATGTSTVLKSVRKTIANAVVSTTILIKQIRLPRAFAAIGTVAYNDLLVKIINFAISAVGISTVISRKAFIASYVYVATGVNTLAKRIAKTLAATVSGLSNVLKAVRLPRFAVAIGTATLSFGSVATRAFSAVATGLVTFAKTFLGGFVGPAQKVYKRSRFIMNNFGRW